MNEDNAASGDPREPMAPASQPEPFAGPGEGTGGAAPTGATPPPATGAEPERQELAGPVVVASPAASGPSAANRKRGGCSRIFFGLIILALAAIVGFLSTPYAGEALNRAEMLWGNMLHRQSERQAGADLEARGALVVYQTGSGNVESVNFQGRAVESDDLAPLLSLHRLLLLDLRNTPVRDADLRYLKNLTNLATLVLSGTAISDDGLGHLVPLRNLEALHLTETAVSDQGTAHLAKLKRLAILDLSHTEVTDEGLQHLTGLANLRWLLLSGTAVTDRGLDTLAELEDLRRLTLVDTQVTPAGVRRLEQALPGIAIDR